MTLSKNRHPVRCGDRRRYPDLNSRMTLGYALTSGMSRGRRSRCRTPAYARQCGRRGTADCSSLCSRRLLLLITWSPTVMTSILRDSPYAFYSLSLRTS